jgi:hypothetical protein
MSRQCSVCKHWFDNVRLQINSDPPIYRCRLCRSPRPVLADMTNTTIASSSSSLSASSPLISSSPSSFQSSSFATPPRVRRSDANNVVLSPENEKMRKRYTVSYLRSLNVPYKLIENDFNIPHNTVTRWARSTSFVDSPRSGRPSDSDKENNM